MSERMNAGYETDDGRAMGGTVVIHQGSDFVTCTLDHDGWLVGPDGYKGVLLPAGEYKVTEYLRPWPECRVYWGTHGCHRGRGHDGAHFCCCDCEDHERDHEEEGCVGTAPYYGPDTVFYGEDSPNPVQ